MKQIINIKFWNYSHILSTWNLYLPQLFAGVVYYLQSFTPQYVGVIWEFLHQRSSFRGFKEMYKQVLRHWVTTTTLSSTAIARNWWYQMFYAVLYFDMSLCRFYILRIAPVSWSMEWIWWFIISCMYLWSLKLL